MATIYICTNAELIAEDYVGLESDDKATIADAYAEAAIRVLDSRGAEIVRDGLYAHWRGGLHAKAGSRDGGYVLGYRSGWVATHTPNPPQWLIDLIEAAADAGDEAARYAAEIVSIIVPERGRVAVRGDLVVVDTAVYRIVEHRGLCDDRGAAIAPDSGATNEWRYDAVLVGDIYDLTQDEYEDALAGYIDTPEV